MGLPKNYLIFPSFNILSIIEIKNTNHKNILYELNEIFSITCLIEFNISYQNSLMIIIIINICFVNLICLCYRNNCFTLFSQGELSQNYCETNFAASNLLQTSTLISEIVKVYYSPHFRSLYTSLGKATELFLQS